MTKKLLALIFAILMVATLFAGCGDKDEKDSALPGGNIINVDPLKGRWITTENGEESFIEFNGDGTGSMGTSSFQDYSLDLIYETNGNNITLKLSFMGQQAETVHAQYSVNGNTLTIITDDESVVYTKQ